MFVAIVNGTEKQGNNNREEGADPRPPRDEMICHLTAVSCCMPVWGGGVYGAFLYSRLLPAAAIKGNFRHLSSTVRRRREIDDGQIVAKRGNKQAIECSVHH